MFEFIVNFFKEYIFGIDKVLAQLCLDYGMWVYVILFLIIFVETGLVVMPFLPGDSLLFTAGAIAATGSLSLIPLMLLLFIAAVLGDMTNYYIGKYFGDLVVKLHIGKFYFVKQKNLDQTHEFFEKHGPKTIIIARFMPIVRTFAPFVAGASEMTYSKFFRFNIIGGGLWILSVTLVGFFFGNLEIVKKNFEYVILGIIFISMFPVVLEYTKIVLKNIQNKSEKPKSE